MNNNDLEFEVIIDINNDGLLFLKDFISTDDPNKFVAFSLTLLIVYNFGFVQRIKVLYNGTIIVVEHQSKVI